MAGHSKFKNIMHRKGAQDKKRSAMFSKLSREITVAAKMGLPDPGHERRAFAPRSSRPRRSRCPRTISSGRSTRPAQSDAENYEEIRYEGFGPGGVSRSSSRRSPTIATARRPTSARPSRRTAATSAPPARSATASSGWASSNMARARAMPTRCWKPRSRPAPTTSQSDEEGHEIWTSVDSLHEVAKALEGALGEADAVKLGWKPGTRSRGPRRRCRHADEAHRHARRGR